MSSLKHFLCVYLFVGFSCLINAQSLPAYRVPLSDDGAIWVVKDIALDFKEYLWLIRNGQVYRYDGSSAVAVGQHIPDWRPENPVGLVGTSDGRMYVAEQHRLGYINLSDWTYHPIQTSFFDRVSQAQCLWIRAEGQQVIVGFDTGHLILVEGDRTEIFSDLVSQVSPKTGALNPPVFGQGRWYIPFQWGDGSSFLPVKPGRK